ncbi:hypothetical protein Patl1_12010 [Pistacia atlantica]|uniref:Uncharacterized protein n=1 Tax=Pistacia atlantica TaxID=434234 RepID=A0ACC1A579_9ROSI|nr:hypothetical protein Patl1_12010 [Pistacia atlantica]
MGAIFYLKTYERREQAGSRELDRKLRELERKRKIQSLRERSTRINQTVASTSNSEISLTLSSLAIEYRLTKIYETQVKLYKAAKEDDVDLILNFFFRSDETVEELASSFLYETVESSNTLLHVAASFGSTATVGLIADYLISLPILDRKNSNGDTALHVAAKAGHLSTVTAVIYPQVESSFLTSSDDGLERVTFREDDYNLPFSFRLQNEEGITALRPADYDRSLFLGLTNEDGNTALQEALINGHTAVAQALIEADP